MRSDFYDAGPERWTPPPLDDDTGHYGSLLALVATATWKAQGACRDVDPRLFFPERGESTREAKAVCAGCPVRAECLEYALDQHEHFGIWGGTSERERRRLRPSRPPRPVQTVHPPEKKQRAVAMANTIGVHATAREFGVDPRQIHKWRRVAGEVA